MARVIVISTQKNGIYDSVYETEINELEDFYNHIGCSCIDVARRKIADRWFDMWVDDEGLLKDDQIVTACDINGHPMLVGGLIIANHDRAGNTTSLSDDDIELIKDNIFIYTDRNNVKRPVVLCNYN